MERDLFLVASEPFQEAQQEQDPSPPPHSRATQPGAAPGPAFHTHTPEPASPAALTSIPRRVRNATERPGQWGHPPPDGMEGGCRDGTPRAGSGHSCSLLERPDQAWLFPAGQTEVEELKLVQDPALAPPGSFPGNCHEGRARSRTWGFSASLEASQATKWGGNSRKGTELVSVRIREWGRWSSGESREKAAGMRERLALVSLDTPVAAGRPSPGWERAGSAESKL